MSHRAKVNRELIEEITAIFNTAHRVYGSPRISAELIARGRKYNKKRIQRLMRENGLRARTKKKFKVTTVQSKTKKPELPDLVGQNFTAEKLNKVWASDITYIRTDEGWLYLCAIMDLKSKRTVGWAMSHRINADMVLSAIKQAVKHRRPEKGLIFHSDKGRQYDSEKVRKYLSRHKFSQSMGKKGNCYDNAAMESFFHSLKTEWVKFNWYETRMQAMVSIFEYVEIFYNRQRRHSSIGYKTPDEFELLNS
jgi:transposase InsO family protein